MFVFSYVLLLSLVEYAFPTKPDHIFHLMIERRGGSLATREPVNLTILTDLAKKAESNYGATKRAIRGNRPIRAWKSGVANVIDGHDLRSTISDSGSWYAQLEIGQPGQVVEAELDMLAPDFYIRSTTNRSGSMFETFFSSSYDGEHKPYVHSICTVPSDFVHLPNVTGLTTTMLDIPTCSPPKSTSRTFLPHGSVLGLSPPDTMARLSSSSFTQQLRHKNILKTEVWSLTLLNRNQGILSLGGTIAQLVEAAKIRTQVELSNINNPYADSSFVEREVERQLSHSFSGSHDSGAWSDASWAESFRWSPVQGAIGWWTTLMSGVWINGIKVLNNQPVLLDIQVPFIIAPSIAAKRFYENIGGAKQLPEPDDRFYVFPCLNPPNIAFEFAGWMFPTMSGEGTTEDAFWGPPGGRLSLGKVRDGSGYCVGAVVESRIGRQEEGNAEKQLDRQKSRERMESGLQQTWIIGEPFFQGTGVVFDTDRQRIGFRSY